MPAQTKETAGPFVGLRPFARREADSFLGRDRETDELLDRVLHPGYRVLVLTGAAGVGKTSLVEAGLRSRTSQQGPQAPLLLSVRTHLGLRRQLTEALEDLGLPVEDPAGLLPALSGLEGRLDRPVILVLDDAEWLWRDSRWEPDRPRLADKLLAGSLEGRLPRILLVTPPEGLPPILERASPRQAGKVALTELQPFDRERAREWIERAVLQAGRYLEAGLAATLADQLSRRGPILPLDLQLAAGAVFQTGATTLKALVRQGGLDAVTDSWLAGTCARAGGHGLPILSALADRAEAREEWSEPEELAALAGCPPDEVESAGKQLEADGLAERSQARLRLSSRALVRHVRRVDGRIRLAQTRARKVLAKAAAGKGLLGPRELLAARRYARTPAEQDLVRRSSLLLGSAVAALLAVLVGALVWAHVAALSSISLAASGRAPDDTVVVKRGGGPARHFVLPPWRGELGRVVEDTALPAAALRGATIPLPSETAWPRRLLAHMRPRPAALLRLALAPPEGWERVSETARLDALRTLRLAGLLAPPTRPVVRWLAGEQESARSHLRLAAQSALLEMAVRQPTQELLRVLDTQLPAGTIPEGRASGLTSCQALGVLARDPAWRWQALERAAEKLDKCPAAAAEAAVQALASDVPGLRARGAVVLARALGRPGKVPPEFLDFLAKRGSPLPETVLFAMDSLGRRLPADKLWPALRPTLVSGGARAASRAAALAARSGLADRLLALIGELASRSSPPERLRAARLCRSLRRVQPGPIPAPVQALLRDAEHRVQAAALRCAAECDNPPAGRILALLNHRRPAVRLAAYEAFAAARRDAPDAYKIAKFLYNAAKGGPPGSAGAVALAASRLVRNPRQWDVARFFVFPAAKSPVAADRKAAALAAGRLAAIKPGPVLRVLRRLAADRNEAVQEAVLRVLVSLPDAVRSTALPILDTLASKAPDRVRSELVLLVPFLRGLRSPEVLSKLLAAGGEAFLDALAMAVSLPPSARPPNLRQLAARGLSKPSGLLAAAGRSQAAGLALAHALVAAGMGDRLADLAAEAPSLARAALKATCSREEGAQVAARLASKPLAPELVELMARCLQRRPGWSHEGLAALFWAVARSGGSGAEQALTALAVSATRPQGFEERLGEAARSPNALERAGAARAMGFTKGWDRELDRLLQDPVLSVRRQAVFALARRWAASRTPRELARDLRRLRRKRQERMAAALALSVHPKRAEAGNLWARLSRTDVPLLAVLARTHAAWREVPIQSPEASPLARVIDLLFLY